MVSQAAIGHDDIGTQFWRSVSERSLRLPWCAACARFFFYPRPFCPRCWSHDVELRPAGGGGTIWAHTVVRFAHGSPSPWHQRLPYALALVELDEGPRIMANIVGCAMEDIRTGMRVRLTYMDLDGRVLYGFELARP